MLFAMFREYWFTIMFKYSTDAPYINTVVLKKISGQLILLKTWIFRLKKKTNKIQ